MHIEPYRNTAESRAASYRRCRCCGLEDGGRVVGVNCARAFFAGCGVQRQLVSVRSDFDASFKTSGINRRRLSDFLFRFEHNAQYVVAVFGAEANGQQCHQRSALSARQCGLVAMCARIAMRMSMIAMRMSMIAMRMAVIIMRMAVVAVRMAMIAVRMAVVSVGMAVIAV